MKRIALVTGGTRGLGRAISIALREQGCDVASVYHGNEAAAHNFEAEAGIPVFQWDVANFDACRTGISDVTKKLGPIDILINNAGITRDAPLRRMTEVQWSDVITTNLGSMFNMCRQVIDGMRERTFGRIVNISSINGQKAQFSQTNYAAAKAGIIGDTAPGRGVRAPS